MKRPLLALLVALVLAATARAEDWDARLRAAGYVDLQLLIPSLRVELKYATADNFMGRPVYDGLTRAFLHPDAARKLRRAHELLRLERPDLTLCDTLGHALPMGTPFDHFGPTANIDREPSLVRTGRITQQELQNRLLLRRVMRAAGFTTVTSEWWHFNACPAARARASYPLIGK